ncbi:MAG: 2'-5' RNA ligase family protein [Rhodanobacteraceae bacterium]|nr:2'-5' RNA ligase family protein [Rhodanobacteraceae bacterium]
MSTSRRKTDAATDRLLAAEGGLRVTAPAEGDSVTRFFDLMELAEMLSPVWPPRELAQSGDFRLSGNSSTSLAQADMPQQSSLFGSAPPEPTDRLFLGIFPDTATAARIDALAAEVCARHGIRAPRHRPERLHVTLFHIGDWAGLSQYTVDTVVAAAGRVSATPFQVQWNEVASFSSRRERSPLVLKASAGNECLHRFRAQLGAELSRVGLGRCAVKAFEPHVTLAYAAEQIAPEPVEPIDWNVVEFVLIHSLLGQTRHVRLGAWPLGA